MHYAVHGRTAAEIITERADHEKPFMGLTGFKGNYLTVQDARIAKNYLTEKELTQLNLIVSLFLDFAELQAMRGTPMKMADWLAKLDDFLKLSERELLTHAGRVSADEAAEKAEKEYQEYRKKQDKNYVSDFDRAVKKLETETKTGKRPPKDK